MQRDVLNAYVTNPSRLAYFSICDNQPAKKLRHRFLKVV